MSLPADEPYVCPPSHVRGGGLMRRAGRKDATQAQIVQALRDIGVVVFVVNHAGLPDLLTYSRGVWLPIEIKYSRLARSFTDRFSHRLSPAQCATYAVAPFPIVDSVASALALFRVRT